MQFDLNQHKVDEVAGMGEHMATDESRGAPPALEGRGKTPLLASPVGLTVTTPGAARLATPHVEACQQLERCQNQLRAEIS